jgi:hypothetical protein
MRLLTRLLLLLLTASICAPKEACAINPPTNVIISAGDQSIIVHWDRNSESNLGGYRIYRSLTNGAFTLLNSTGLVTTAGYCDMDGKVINGQTNRYQITAVTTTSQESSPSITVAATPHPFASDDEFLDYLQQANFYYFWYSGNPNNGLVPDRSAPGSACSIAAVGFGLTAIGIAVDHGWISREQGATRVATTLNTFLNGPQGPGTSGIIGYKGWFYHFLDMNTAVRAGSVELSSIDTALLLGGVLYAKQYFDGSNATEASIRATADAIFNRIDWNWMAQGTDVVSMGWQPSSGFLAGNWIGYDEGMILYILGLGAATNPLPGTAWSRWTNGYTWTTSYSTKGYVPFAPLFGHQYSHCWIDFRHVADGFMNAHNSSYFENSRRASLAQQAYCIANPLGKLAYSSTNWGLTACDGPGGYAARGAPPPGTDDGTIAPTAAGGSIAFAPEACLPALRNFYKSFRTRIWTSYGFRDSFNLGASPQYFGPDELGIDQGPIVIMIENYRTQKIWNVFMRNSEVQRGLQRAGFVSLAWAPLQAQADPAANTVTLTWNANVGRTYQVEYSPDLFSWFGSPAGEIVAAAGTAGWTDSGPPATPTAPLASAQRFYRVFQFGVP